MNADNIGGYVDPVIPSEIDGTGVPFVAIGFIPTSVGVVPRVEVPTVIREGTETFLVHLMGGPSGFAVAVEKRGRVDDNGIGSVPEERCRKLGSNHVVVLSEVS